MYGFVLSDYYFIYIVFFGYTYRLCPHRFIPVLFYFFEQYDADEYGYSAIRYIDRVLSVFSCSAFYYGRFGYELFGHKRTADEYGRSFGRSHERRSCTGKLYFKRPDGGGFPVRQMPMPQWNPKSLFPK